MSVDTRLLAIAERFLSARTFHLVVAPAVADLQFERGAGFGAQTANRLAVLRAISGGACDDLARASGGMLLLTLMPAGYYIFLLVICFDVFSLSMTGDFVIAAFLILLLSFAPVMACFWPERSRVQSLE